MTRTLTHLLRLRQDLTEDKQFRPGICSFLDLDERHEFIEIAKRWEHYSGMPEYPVPMNIGSKSEAAAIAAYREAHTYNKLWDVTSEYGQLRIHLLNFAILELSVKEAKLTSDKET